MEYVKFNCYSYQFYKGVFVDCLCIVFNGWIFVYQEVQKIDVVQNNCNLLFSDEVIVNSNLQFEIFVDDVKCMYGLIIGQFEDDVYFYLCLCGVDVDVVKGFLVYVFVSEVLQEIEIEVLCVLLECILVYELVSGV